MKIIKNLIAICLEIMGVGVTFGCIGFAIALLFTGGDFDKAIHGGLVVGGSFASVCVGLAIFGIFWGISKTITGD